MCAETDTFEVLARAVARVASIGSEEQADRPRHDLPDGQAGVSEA